MTEDERQLDLLSIFHYVVGGITGLFACFPLVHLGLGLMMIFSDFNVDPPPPAFVGWLFAGMGGVMVLGGWTMAVLIIIAGRKLKKRVSRTYCTVVAGLECLMMPFGTILGIFTIVVLTKDSVKKLFELNEPSAPSD